VSAKLLLIRTGCNAFNAQALVVTEGGLYHRPLASEAEFSEVNQTEKFNLIVCDGRGKEAALLELTEKIRSYQADAHIVLVCEKPPLDFVVKAIRLGVRDLFPVPVNLGGVLTRVDELIKPFFTGGGAAALANCRSSLTLFLTADGAPSLPAATKGASAADLKELNTLRLECDRLGRALQAAQETQNLAATTRVSRGQDIEAREQALAEMETAFALLKNKQVAEQESLNLSRAALAQAQLAATQTAAALAEREQQLAQLLTSQTQAGQAHEEALAEFEVNEQLLAARENALAAEKTKFDEAQKKLPLAQARLAQETAELVAQRQAIQGELADFTKARTELESQQAKLIKETARIEAEAAGLDQSLAEQAVKVAELSKRTQGVLSQERALDARAAALAEAESRVAEMQRDARAAVAPLLAQAEQRAGALAAREVVLAAKEKEVAKLLARLEADADAAAEEHAHLDAAKLALAKTSAGLAAREAKLDTTEKLHAEQAVQIKKEQAAVKNQLLLVEADRQALELENTALAEKIGLLETKRHTMQALISSV
jgi:hypothetical protein